MQYFNKQAIIPTQIFYGSKSREGLLAYENFFLFINDDEKRT